MSVYLEIPDWKNKLPFREFENMGEIVVAPHWHKEIEIIYVTKGSVTIGYDNKLFQVHEKEIFVFGSGESHYILASPNSKRQVYQFDLSVYRHRKISDKDYKQLVSLFEKAENYSRLWPDLVSDKMRTCLEELSLESQAKQVGCDFAIVGALHKLLMLYYREVPQKEKTLVSGNFVDAIHQQDTLERLNSIFIYIEEHYQAGVTLEEVAKFTGFSPHYFSRFFKKNTGQTFMQFLTEHRVAQAKYILAHDKLPMIEISERAGFNSVKTFHHVFKEHVGMSPLKYQKTIFGNN